MSQRRTTLGILQEPQLGNAGRNASQMGSLGKPASQATGRPSYAPGRTSNVRPGLGNIMDGMAGLSVGGGGLGGRQTASLAGNRYVAFGRVRHESPL
jgi:hypothetical protein